MAATGHGATFTFISDRGTFSGSVTRIKVDSPTAEIADMTGVSDGVSNVVLVPTGSWMGGGVDVDYVSSSGVDPQALVRGVGALSFVSTGLTVSRQVILESATAGVGVNEAVRGSLKFLRTDYYP
jgi:hypothetical protein